MNTETILRSAKRYESAQALLSNPEYRFVRGFSNYHVLVNEERKYKVDMLTSQCTCPDYQRHGDFCKHSMAVGLLQEQEAQLKAAETYLREEANAEDAEWGVSPL